MPTYTVTGTFTMVYSGVPGAASYIVQRDTLATFATPRDTTIAATNTSPTVSIVLTKPSNVRVLAVAPSGAHGQPSASRVIAAVTQVTVSPATATIAAGATQTFTAEAKDAGGNPVTGVTFFWASSNQNVALVDQAGVATGTGGGAATITALGLGLPGSAALTVTGGVPTQLAFSVHPTSATAGVAIAPVVKVEVRDAKGNRISTASNAVTVAIASNAGGGTISGTLTVSAMAGEADFSDLSINKAGTGYTLTASAPGLTPATSGPFGITAAAAANLAFVVEPTSGEPNHPLGPAMPAIGVAIRDQFGNTVPSATNSVTMALGTNLSGATLSGTTPVAAVNGVATFGDLAINKTGNGYTLSATATGLIQATSNSFDMFLHFVSVSGGGGFAQFSCGVTTSGAVYCWGTGGQGQLGNGGTATSNIPVPVTLPAGVTFASVTAGGFGTTSGHACALTSAGAAYCWGTGANGRLGNGGTANSSVPVAVTMPTGVTFTGVSAGEAHTCALSTTGGGFCWGLGANGRLGAGTADASTPQPVSGGLLFSSISAGGSHSCGVRVDGLVFCWGLGQSGQRGSGGTIGSIADAVSPEQIASGSVFLSVSGGDNHTCAVASDGSASCWGLGTSGQLGNNTTTSISTPSPVSGGLKFGTVSAGGRTTCALSTAGAAICWGEGSNSQLGNGATANSPIPVSVVGGRVYLSLKAGAFTNCPVAPDGVFCWGFGGQGELGDGTTSSSSIPVRVLGTR